MALEDLGTAIKKGIRDQSRNGEKTRVLELRAKLNQSLLEQSVKTLSDWNLLKSWYGNIPKSDIVSNQMSLFRERYLTLSRRIAGQPQFNEKGESVSSPDSSPLQKFAAFCLSRVGL